MLRKPILIMKFWCGIAALNPLDIRECMGDLTVDEDNPILKAEQEAQVGSFPLLLETLHSDTLQYACCGFQHHSNTDLSQ
jgi:hypothetical protein